MNEKILKIFFNEITNDEILDYPADIKTNLLEVAEEELTDLDISFKRNNTKKNVLEVYNESSNPLNYVKGFYPNNSNLGRLICKDKFLTQRFLDFSQIKTPKGKVFTPEKYKEAEKFINDNPDISFVLKPVSMSMSLGTFLNVNKKNLKSSWIESFNIQSKYNIKKPRVLIQEQIAGLEIRIIVIEGKASSAVFRAPGNVCGDGKNTIRNLIHIKNEKRNKHNYLRKNPLKINDNLIENLEKKGLTLDTILPDGEYCILYSQSSIATGREVYEVSKYLNENIYKQALDSVTAIPGAHTAGVDIFVENLNSLEGTVIEVNLNPAFQLHYYPMTGTKSAPIYDIFESYDIDRKMLSGELKLKNLSDKDFEVIKDRYKFLYNKEREISKAFRMFLKPYL